MTVASSAAGPHWTVTLRWVGAIGVVIAAMLRMVVLFAPAAVFDTDPALDPSILGGLALAGSLRVDAAILLAAALCLLGEAAAGRGIDLRLVVLGLVPVPVALWHAAADAEHLRIGATWIAAIAGAVALAHASREPRLRLVLAVLLLSVLGPILVRGYTTATVEHAETVAAFEANRDRILLDKGWQPDSASALIFERRLRQAQPTAWFVSTNVFGSCAGVMVVVCTGLVARGWRRGVRRDALLVLAGVGGVAAYLLWMTGSSGAIVAAAGGVGLALLTLAWSPGRHGGRLAVAVVAIAFAGIAVRGVILPESFAGERSLLFRWHYQVGAAHALAEAPITGTGTAGFQSAYARLRPPRSPEEVRSTHSVLTDWIARLGISGVAWSALTLLLIARAGSALASDGSAADGDLRREGGDEPRMTAGAWGRVLLAGSGLGVAAGIVFELPTLSDAALGVRAAGVAAALGLGALLAFVVTRVSPWTVLAAAAITLLVHGQIEVTMTEPASAVWCLALLGIAAAPSAMRTSAPPGPVPRWTFAAPAAFAGIAVWIVVTGAVPAARLESAMFAAARPLWPIADARAALGLLEQGGLPSERDRAVRVLDESLAELGVDAARRAELGPAEIDALLREAERARRVPAADALLEARKLMPTSIVVAEAALTQLERANWRERGAERIALLEREVALIEEILPRSGRARTLAPWVYDALARLTGDAAWSDRHIAFLEARTEANPWGLEAWLAYADALWEAGRRDEAATAYRHVLDCDENFALDELKQLGISHRERVEERAR